MGTLVGRKRIFPDREGPVSNRRVRHRSVGGYRRFQRDDSPAGLRHFPAELSQGQHHMRSILEKK